MSSKNKKHPTSDVHAVATREQAVLWPGTDEQRMPTTDPEMLDVATGEISTAEVVAEDATTEEIADELVIDERMVSEPATPVIASQMPRLREPSFVEPPSKREPSFIEAHKREPSFIDMSEHAQEVDETAHTIVTPVLLKNRALPADAVPPPLMLTPPMGQASPVLAELRHVAPAVELGRQSRTLPTWWWVAPVGILIGMMGAYFFWGRSSSHDHGKMEKMAESKISVPLGEPFKDASQSRKGAPDARAPVAVAVVATTVDAAVLRDSAATAAQQQTYDSAVPQISGRARVTKREKQTTPVSPVTPPPTPNEPTEDAPSQAAGQIIVKADPWAYIYVDGKKTNRITSATPLTVSAGVHEIELVNPELKLRHRLTIDVPPGGIVRRFVKLQP